MAAQVEGSVADLIARLGQIGGRAVKAVNDQMAAESATIYTEIFNRMPVRFGDLENSLTIDSYQRKKWVIYVDTNAPAQGRWTVGAYAEWLENGEYNLGEASAAKGSDVGPHFMERGLQAAVDNGAIDRCRDALRDAVESNGG